MKARPPLGERAKRDVEKSALEHEQKWQAEILSVSQRVPDEIAKVNRESHFDEREEGRPGASSATEPSQKEPTETASPEPNL